jgi:hypothetical protein
MVHKAGNNGKNIKKQGKCEIKGTNVLDNGRRDLVQQKNSYGTVM